MAGLLDHGRLADVKANAALSLPSSAHCFSEERLQLDQGDRLWLDTEVQPERLLPTLEDLIEAIVW